MGDVVEFSADLRPEQVERLDRELVEAGLPTLGAMRARFMRGVNRILARGVIRSEREYYAVRNVADEADGELRKQLWGLLDGFEERRSV